MIKLVVSDMDGTLLKSDGSISKRNVETIHHLKELHIDFAIASGRDYEGVYPIMNQYNIDCEAILGNGAQYVDQKGRIILDCYLDKSVAKDIVYTLEEHHVPYMIFTTRGFYTTCLPEYVKDMFLERGLRRFGHNKEDFNEGGKKSHSPCCMLQHIDDFDEFIKRDLEIIKFEAFSLDIQDIPPIKECLKDIASISYLSSFDDNVEITNQYAQKGLILEKVIKQKGIKKEEVVVLGDGMNDISMFQCFPFSFAPSNSSQVIKDLSYKVVGDCQKDGFSEAIEYILEKES